MIAVRRYPAIAAIAAATAVSAALAGCSSAAPPRSSPPAQVVNPSPSPGAALSAADWPAYDRDAGRSGAAPTAAPVRRLAVAWRSRLDGAVYGQPLIIGQEIIAATEGGTIYALRAPTGIQIWHRHVADPVPLGDLPCGDIDPLGITGTPVYDPASGLIFAVAETTGGRHILAGVSLASGRLAVQREVEPPRGDRLATQQRPALTLYGGRVYIAFGGLDGDCGQYIGSVVSVATSGRGPVESYAIPTSRMGGMWATGGVVVAGNRLIVSAGNGASTSAFDGSDSVTALSPELRRLDIFAPSAWAADNASDADLGSMTPAVAGPFVFISGKNGTGYVLRVARLGGVGGEVAHLRMCSGFGTGAVSGSVVYVPCIDTGIKQVTIGADGTPHAGWTAQASSAHGSPVTGGGAVWVVDWEGGVLYALDSANGTIKGRVEVGKAPHFASLSLSGSHAYVGVLDGVVAVTGA